MIPKTYLLTFKEYKEFIKSDLYRIHGKNNFLYFLKIMRPVHIQPYKYIFWMRTCNYLQNCKGLKILFYKFSQFILYHYSKNYGIQLSPNTKIGKGLNMYHFGGIVINSETRIGKNCTISHGVTIGQLNRGAKKGTPSIGDSVFLGPNCTILGNIHIGNGCAIGANCVVTFDLPENSVVVNSKPTIISFKGSESYVNNKV